MMTVPYNNGCQINIGVQKNWTEHIWPLHRCLAFHHTLIFNSGLSCYPRIKLFVL